MFFEFKVFKTLEKKSGRNIKALGTNNENEFSANKFC
jgi:hypothetical protein